MGGKRGGFDEGVSEDEPEKPGGGDGEGGRRTPENNYNKLNWKGPTARKNQIASGGGGMPARPIRRRKVTRLGAEVSSNSAVQKKPPDLNGKKIEEQLLVIIQ